MTKLLKAAQAGSVESTDILIMVAPAETGAGIKIELVSPTVQQYGEQIKNVISSTLIAHGIEDAIVHANDKGALNFTIEARVTTAISRALS
ncbi:citrate lyase acyl carrier protein [Sporomusa sp.]|uniref:citrate lyase acyl carrier protein n=1 Tax=Sporomusa sp. TaxID=2078658 RepID=UPI002C45547B|nr:citrate lyase acyl carrier protein [Sporomusa sp.]HWR43411.1 citrate lyase acyl carrier protein [Sporomusa sp.]